MLIRTIVLGGVAALAAAGAAEASFTQEPGSPFKVLSSGPYDVLPATDVNADGRLDVMTANGDSNTLSVLLRQPAGGFEPETGSPFPLGTGAIGGNYGTVADFNRDGRPDVAVTTNSGHVSVQLRQAAGGYALEANPPQALGTSASSVAAGDFNGDGHPDLAAPSYGNAMTVLLRKPAGGFTTAAVVVPGGAHRFVAVGEFNGDSDPDLAISNSASGTVTIMLGAAGGGFVPEAAPIAVGATPHGLVVQDFDGDGRHDIAVANLGHDSVTVLLRRGGGFVVGPGSPLGVGDGPAAVATGDFNSDGTPDLVSANQTSSNVSVLLGRGGGAFAAEAGSPIRTDLGAADVAVGDFDADGRPDLAISNIGGNTVTILLNTTPFPAAPSPPPPPGLDGDGDGVQRPADCDDANPAIRPGVRDVPGDGIDQDCVGGDAPFPLLKRRIAAITATYPSGYMTFTSMSVKPARRGDRLRVTCRGAGCEFRKRKIRVGKRARKLSLMKRVRGMKLRKGAVVQLRVTRPGTIGRVRTWRVRAPRIPIITDRCLRPGGKKLIRCPRG